MPDEGQRESSDVVTVESQPIFDIVEDTLLDLWKAVDDLARIHAPRLPYYRVTIFGSSRMREGDTIYGSVQDLARELSLMGCDIVTGGGPGLMEAANRGAEEGDIDNRTRSFGLNIEVPHEQEINPYVEKAYVHRTFFTRLHHFVRLSSAFVVVPGGIGTTLEALMVWQLMQVRHITDRPFIMLGTMWRELVAWGRRFMLDGGTRPLAGPGDLDLPRCVESVDEAVAIIRRDLARVRGEAGTDVAGEQAPGPGGG
ncbi:MAG: LOG family protein [Candidatus Palauibacterales bacterium]|nr:LOG family protein [Candidatus Palauibacterales bacterium]MDP2530239.1 LOG family protein [Candidatus Palauibacterales bacterium]MDP2583024.1 LOG family protein [Candidatus Palauibacterales bacterium]